MKRKIFTLFIILSLLISSIPVSISASSDDTVTVDNNIEITYSTKESKIYKGDIFNLEVTFSEAYGSGIGNEITVAIPKHDYFEPTGDASKKLEKGESYEFSIKYLGGTDKIPVKVTYKKDGSSITKTVNMTLSELDYSDSSSGSSSDSRNEPRLIIENTSIPTAAAGESIKLPLTITNETNYQAKNISIKLSLGSGEQSPFEVDSLNLSQSISSLGGKKHDNVTFNLRISPYALEKTYAINVDLKYNNQRNNSFTSTETVYIKVTNESNGPMLVLKDIKSQPDIVKAGEKVNIGFRVSNIGDMAAKGVKVSLTGLKKDEFTILNGSGSDYIERIDGNKYTDINYVLNTSDKMESGNYSLGIKLEYKDGSNNKTVDEQNVFVNVQGKGKSSNIVVKNIVVNPAQIMANESFSLSFDVMNAGKSRAENVKVSIKGDEGIMSKSPDIKIIEELMPGETQKADFMLFAGDQLKSKSYNIHISIEYEDAAKENSKFTSNQYTGIYVNGSNSKLTPKIIINNYKFEPNIVRAGEQFSLDMSFLNTSRNKTVRNVKIFLTGIDSDKEGKVVFTPVNSSNTFFIDSIAPKKTAKESLTMYTIPDAQPMTYTITANFEYQDEEGTEYKATELIGIPVIQQSKLDAGEISIPPEVYIGEPTPINIQYFNKGKTKLTNLMITIEGDFDVQNKQTYIGNFESGSSDGFEANITPKKAGQLNGKFIFTFDDPSGDSQEFIREFSINAVDMPPMEPSDVPPEGADGNKSLIDKTIKNKFFWIGLVAFSIAALFGFKLWRKKRKKGIELDE